MAVLSLKIYDKNGDTLAVSKGEDFVDLVYAREYNEGDVIELSSSEQNLHINWQVDDALGKSFVYVSGTVQYNIPFGEKRISYSPKVFSGSRHYIWAEVASEAEVKCYRNLALNPADQHKDVPCYPHATANVETRGESVFAAKNAIDGVRADLSHGEWPYESWGINRQDDAELTLEYGREVIIDKIVLYLRADFPHDNWWKQVTFSFSDGTEETVTLEKSERAHVILISPRKVTWLKFGKLIKADDPSPFPALTQIETYGTVCD